MKAKLRLKRNSFFYFYSIFPLALSLSTDSELDCIQFRYFAML